MMLTKIENICLHSPFVTRLSQTGPTLSNEKEKYDYAAYSENKLLKAGDIETHPGPQKLPTFKIIALLLVAFLVLLMMGICNYNAQATENSPEIQIKTSPLRITTRQSLDSASHLLVLRNKKKRKKHVNISSLAAYLLILLLIAGDIEQNPGPNAEHCLRCKQPEDNIQALTCDTCRGWSHISCTGQRNKLNRLIKNSSFQWHCPNPTCLPNHHESNESTLKHTPNRYNILNKKCNQAPETKKSKLHKKTNLLVHLPKIKPKEYIGREICKACHKTVGANHRAISCDDCSRLTHQKCSDMPITVYNSHATKNEEFPWVCNTCRKPEDAEITTDIKKLKLDDCPISNEDLVTCNGDFLILHYNCRSLLNKVEELTDICMKLKPKIICLTETWLDDSTPQTANIPDGYKILRCDRSDRYKQKYGKTNGGGTAVLYSEDIKIRKLNVDTEDQETQWIEVKANQIFILGIVYRAHYTDLLEEKEQEMPLEKQLYDVSLRTRWILVTGDFNCDVSA